MRKLRTREEFIKERDIILELLRECKKELRALSISKNFDGSEYTLVEETHRELCDILNELDNEKSK